MDSQDGKDAASGAGGETSASSHPPPSTSKRIPQKHMREDAMDEEMLSRHRAAQQAALSAAKLGGTAPKKGRRGTQIALSMLGGVILGLAGVGAYWKTVQAEVAVPTSPPRPAPASPATAPEATAPEDIAEPVASSPPDGQGGATAGGGGADDTGSEEAAAEGVRVKVQPPTAGVLVDGERVELVDGAFVLEGEVGSKHNVVMTVGAKSRPFSVEITEDGAQPPVLDLIAGLPATGPAPRRGGAPPPAGGPPPRTAPPPPPTADDIYE